MDGTSSQARCLRTQRDKPDAIRHNGRSLDTQTKRRIISGTINIAQIHKSRIVSGIMNIAMIRHKHRMVSGTKEEKEATIGQQLKTITNN